VLCRTSKAIRYAVEALLYETVSVCEDTIGPLVGFLGMLMRRPEAACWVKTLDISLPDSIVQTIVDTDHPSGVLTILSQQLGAMKSLKHLSIRTIGDSDRRFGEAVERVLRCVSTRRPSFATN